MSANFTKCSGRHICVLAQDPQGLSLSLSTSLPLLLSAGLSGCCRSLFLVFSLGLCVQILQRLEEGLVNLHLE